MIAHRPRTAVCVVCGYSHEPERRQRALRRMLPNDLETMAATWPCWWGDAGGRQTLLRDLEAIGARRVDGQRGEWEVAR